MTTVTPHAAGLRPRPHVPLDGHRRHAAGRRAPRRTRRGARGAPSSWSSGSPPTCTRFDPTSALMRANAAPQHWHEVPAELFDALREAARRPLRHRRPVRPAGPRVLTSWGYDRSLPFGPATSRSRRTSRPAAPRPGRRRWRPGSTRPPRGPPRPGPGRPGRHRQGPRRALGGAGARRQPGPPPWSRPAATCRPPARARTARLARGGRGPPRRVRPGRGAEPGRPGCATSSIRLRRWPVDGRPVHHLVDPRTGDPADTGLLAVTVVGPDVARAEVWSKALFLAGRGQVRRLADDRGLAALLRRHRRRGRREPGDAAAPRWQADRGW